MSGYDQILKINASFEKEARNFLIFLQNVGRKYDRPTRINFRYLNKGRFYIIIDGSSGGIDALFQELILNRGLYYYSCTLKNKSEIIKHVILPIYKQFVDQRFSNPQSRFIRKHILGKYSQNDFVPTDIKNKYGYEFVILFRKWDIGLLSNKVYLINLDAILTEFLLKKINHKEGGLSPKFDRLLSIIGNNFVLNKEIRKAFSKVHHLSRETLHRLTNQKKSHELIMYSNNLWRYFEYLDEFEESQKIKTIKIRGKRYKRIKYGSKREVWEDENGIIQQWMSQADNKPCGDCNVIKGQYHVEGCDIELCPKCGGQYISCDCGIPT